MPRWWLKVDVDNLYRSEDGDDGNNKKKESAKRMTLTRTKIKHILTVASTFVSKGGTQVYFFKIQSFSTNTVRD